MKFCRECNTQNTNAAVYCSCCGASIVDLQITGPSEELPLDVAEEIWFAQKHTLVRNDYQRLGGWLNFFVVLDFLTAFYYLINILVYFNIMPAVGLDVSVQTVLSAFLFAICFASSIMIIKRDSRFLLVRQLYYIVSFGFGLVWSMVTLFTLSEDLVVIAITAVIVLMFSAGLSVVLFILMTLYFCKSKRVNTYMAAYTSEAGISDDEYKRKALIKF